MGQRSGCPNREIGRDGLIRRSGFLGFAIALVAGLISVLYFATSAVMVANAFVWLPTFPDPWYDLRSLIYGPFRPYFDYAVSTLGRVDVPYSAYTVMTQAPFVVLSLVILGLSLRRLLRGS